MFQRKNRKVLILCLLPILGLLLHILWYNVLSLDDLESKVDDWERELSGNFSLERVHEEGKSKSETNPSSVPILNSKEDEIEKGEEKGCSILINLDEYRLYLYKDGKQIRTYSVSGGKPSTPSPTGIWKVTSKAEWGEGFGGAWMGFNVPWATG